MKNLMLGLLLSACSMMYGAASTEQALITKQQEAQVACERVYSCFFLEPGFCNSTLTLALLERQKISMQKYIKEGDINPSVLIKDVMASITQKMTMTPVFAARMLYVHDRLRGIMSVGYERGKSAEVIAQEFADYEMLSEENFKNFSKDFLEDEELIPIKAYFIDQIERENSRLFEVLAVSNPDKVARIKEAQSHAKKSERVVGLLRSLLEPQPCITS